MKKVVITGMGIWSCIGQDLQTVTESLKEGRSGIIFDPKRIEYGLRSGLVGCVSRPDLKPLLPRKFRATMSEDAEYAYMATRQAFEHAMLTDEYLQNNEVGIVWGNDGNVHRLESYAIMEKQHDPAFLSAGGLFRSETSSVTMNLGTIFHLTGISTTIAAACASSAHAIGMATLMIRNGLQHTILVGGSSSTSFLAAAIYEAIDGISYNDNPAKACRPFDSSRDGTVLSGGASALVLEEYEHAIARGANILAEITGIGMCGTGLEEVTMPVISNIGVAIQRALEDAEINKTHVDYVCAAAASLVYDRVEAEVLTSYFGNTGTWVSSIESMTGHEICMAAASKMICSVLMMQHGFVAPNANLERIDDSARTLRIPMQIVYAHIRNVLIDVSGIGGTNCAFVLNKYEHERPR